MRRLIIFLLILIVSVWLGIQVVRHPGYLFIVVDPWMVQMPLWFALLIFAVFVLLLYTLISSIDWMKLLWFRLKSWRRFRREHRSYSKTQHGLAMLIEGRWKKAEQLLLSGLNQSIEPLMNYLGAAKAAHEQGAFERRDNYIQKAYQIAPEADIAIGLTEAELEITQNHYEHAIAILNRLRAASSYHPRVLKLLEKAYVHLSDWQNLLALLPAMRKAKLLNTEQRGLFEKNIYCELLNAATQKSLDEVHLFWRNVPRYLRKDPDVVRAYVKQLLRFDVPAATEEAEGLIRKTLKHHWQGELVKLYGTLPFTNLNRQLVIVGAWLKIYGDRPELLLTLGRLCMRIQLWGKAKDYLERCLDQGPNPEASLEYAKLLEQMNTTSQAMTIYPKGFA